jgi:hypothetical protein
MGFYDCRCMVTGVSLKGAGAALVLLREAGGAHHPVALPVKGAYNRLGSIERIEEDASTALILRYFLDKLPRGELVVEQDYLRAHKAFPVENLEQLLTAFERNINDNPRAAVLNGRPVVFALIARAVWDAIASAAPPPSAPAATVFQRLFKGVPAAEGIYRGNVAKVTRPLQELSGVHQFLAGRGLTWRPAEGPAQHSAEEMRAYLDAARQAFRDSPPALQGLKQYEAEVAALLKGG